MKTLNYFCFVLFTVITFMLMQPGKAVAIGKPPLVDRVIAMGIVQFNASTIYDGTGNWDVVLTVDPGVFRITVTDPMNCDILAGGTVLLYRAVMLVTPGVQGAHAAVLAPNVTVTQGDGCEDADPTFSVRTSLADGTNDEVGFHFIIIGEKLKN